MEKKLTCPFYRDSGTLIIEKQLRYCNLDGNQAFCDGNIQSCKKPDALRKRLEQKRNELSENRVEENQKEKSFRYKVLVVDDEESLRNLIVAFLARDGHQCATASNGIEALAKVRQYKFDAVITDIVMPQMNGIALTKEVLSLYPKLPVMIMTGHSKEYPTELAMKVGARDFIGKPFSYDEFMLRFNKMMSDYKISAELESKQNEMIFHIQRASSDTINELQREIESLKNRLYGGTPFKGDHWGP